MLKITIIAMGNKMPSWVMHALAEFSKRLQEHTLLNLLEIPLTRRGKINDQARILEKERLLMQAAIPQNAHTIALDMQGYSFTSEQLADKILQLQQITGHICFLIGGPEGLDRELIEQCDERWSLSKLTLPHPLVRIILLETLYRSWSIINHHPYHK